MRSPTRSDRPEVAIIGGGFAGLSAAVELSRHGIGVTVVEQKPELGGRAYSFFDDKAQDTVDNGQHLIMGCYRHTLAFLDAIGASKQLTFQDDMTVEMVAPDGSRAALRAARLPGPAHMVAGVLRYRHLAPRDRIRLLLGGARMLAMQRLARAQMERMTVAELMDWLGQPAAVRRAFWYPLAIAALNEEPQRASAALLCEVLRRAFFSRRRDSAIAYAAVGLSELYCEPSRSYIERHGGRIMTHSAVTALEMDGAGRVAGVRLSNGQVLAADCVISAVPWMALVRILPAQLLDSPFFSRLRRLSSSPIICVHLWLDRQVIDAPFVGFIDTTTQWLFNKEALWSGRENRKLAHLSFVISGARSLVELSTQQLAAQVQEDLKKMVPEARAAKILRAIVIKEKQATLAPLPETFALRPTVSTPLENLFLAGDWVATGLPATIESAVASGYEAARAALTRLRA